MKLRKKIVVFIMENKLYPTPEVLMLRKANLIEIVNALEAQKVEINKQLSRLELEFEAINKLLMLQ